MTKILKNNSYDTKPLRRQSEGEGELINRGVSPLFISLRGGEWNKRKVRHRFYEGGRV
jgi:hypothetical protein